ncbi:MAG TPA: CDP-alcohol phosphatidyltransferase family protein [Hyphomicrobiales bacterium]|nr:CDP-alcohol phosphatidyltransferase family protein [Hyphomicrobiales bacterium]
MLAHCLTGLRLLLVLPVAYCFARPQAVPAWLPLLVMAVAITTDLLDGRVARARGTASPAGQLFDHTTDCLFVSAALAGAAYAGFLTPLLPPLVVLAFAQYVLDSRFLHRQKQLRMSSIGRYNGIFYFVPPLLLAFAMPASAAVGDFLRVLVPWCAWALVLSTLVSIIDRALARTSRSTS